MTQRQRAARVQSCERNGVAVELIITITSPAREHGNAYTVRMGVLEARQLAEKILGHANHLINQASAFPAP